MSKQSEFLRLFQFLRVSHGLSAGRARRTKSTGPKGLQLEVGARRAPRLLVFDIMIFDIMIFDIMIFDIMIRLLSEQLWWIPGPLPWSFFYAGIFTQIELTFIDHICEEKL